MTYNNKFSEPSLIRIKWFRLKLRTEKRFGVGQVNASKKNDLSLSSC